MNYMVNNNGIYKFHNNNIYIIGDIHGDYQCLIHCLIDLCKCCKINKIFNDNEFNTKNREELSWINKNSSVIVFCGDMIHRKRFEDNVLDDECSDIYILKTIFRLKREAKKNGGDILIISGNHEIMNLINPDEDLYTSELNLEKNKEYFSDSNFINEYISNSYAWIKLNNILVVHGGLCSEYLKYVDDNNLIDKDGDEIIDYVNNKYHEYFKNINKKKLTDDNIGYNMFINYDINNKKAHNLFWCREWGYNGIDCNEFKNILKKVDCDKMIIAHCPQFLAKEKPKMINFECLSDDNSYTLARIDLGMSRGFDYNLNNEMFLKYLEYNYNRKMSVLKLINDKDNLYFNRDSIITQKISCIQYLLLKYGLTREEWENYDIISNWVGFDYINSLINDSKDYDGNEDIYQKGGNNIMLNLIYPKFIKKYKIDSIKQFKKNKNL